MKTKEKEIQYLWDTKRIPAEFTTISGKPVRILHRGHLNHQRGPDFQHAELLLDGEPQRGDVEIHLRPEDWHAHGHHLDPHYRNVILQVVWSSAGHPPRAADSPETVLLDAQTFSRPEPVTPSSPAPSTAEKFCPAFGVMTPNSLERWFEHLGWERLLRKSRQWADAAADSPAQAFYANLFAALGYTHNSTPMRQLTESVPWAEIQAMKLEGGTVSGLVATWLGVAGLMAHLPKFIPPAVKAKWSELFARTPRILPESFPEWQLFRIRPQNHPVLRLLQIAGMLWNCTDPLRELRNCFALPAEKWRPGEVEKRLSTFLNQSFDEDMSVPPLGPDRLRILLVNVFLPVVMASAADDTERMQALQAFGRALPTLPHNRIEALIRERLGDYQARAVGRSALAQQGMIEVYQRDCETQRCSDCRLTLRRFLRLPDEFQR